MAFSSAHCRRARNSYGVIGCAMTRGFGQGRTDFVPLRFSVFGSAGAIPVGWLIDSRDMKCVPRIAHVDAGGTLREQSQVWLQEAIG